ncbi:MAG TPA: hypothetical protein VNP20_22840 [Nocardioidaceae bacterium]|nr:hypothetical protein [Nocardioidaceae bacterium]
MSPDPRLSDARRACPRSASHPRARQLLLALFGTAFVVSVVHYADNVVDCADYPQTGPAGPPAPSATLIGAAWFLFTAAGLLGIGLFVRGQIVAAAWALTGYAVSGLVGLGHYAAPDAAAMPWWRQAHVLADILCGVLILGFAIWSVVALRPEVASGRARDQAANGT